MFLPELEDNTQKALDILLKAQFGLSKKVKDQETWHSALKEEGYYTRSRFSKEKATDNTLLTLDIAWRSGISYLDLASQHSVLRARKVFDAVFTDKSLSQAWVPRDFYHNAFVPPEDSPLSSAINEKFMDCTLYPYQKRTVQFMLDREGASFEDQAANSTNGASNANEDIPASYRLEKDCDGRNMYVSRTIGAVSHNCPASIRTIKGGILAEEMGLGKTVELISLVLLHKQPQGTGIGPHKDPDSDRMLPATGATLIVTPRHLLDQWSDELSLHAPDLRVIKYKGQKAWFSRKVDYRKAQLASNGDVMESDPLWETDEMHHCDVVLATYESLASDFWYVNSRRDHNLRHEKIHKPQKNPLMEKIWWRVCLDEAQMIDKGVSHTAVVAQQIPRINSWAISGTPFRQHVEDLRGLLLFLRYTPFYEEKIWRRVDKQTFKEIFGKIAIRHSKERVRNELQLPTQKRIVMTVPFIALEEQNYSALFTQMCQECEFGPGGEPLKDEYWMDSPNTAEKMRNWLRRLRQTCLHPQVGTKNRRALGGGTGFLRTVDEVLNAMVVGSLAHVVTYERTIVEAVVQQGHAFAFEGRNPLRASKSLEHYQRALDLITEVVRKCEDAQTKAKEDHPEALGKNNKSKGKSKLIITSMRQNLRYAHELQHLCHFYMATAYFQIKDNDQLTKKESEEFKELESQESSHYETAKVIRRELLTENRLEAEKTMERLQGLQPIRFTEVWLPGDSSGIENVRIMERYESIAKLLNKQATFLGEWQLRVRRALLKTLIDTERDDELTGEEYEESTKVEAEVGLLYLALRAVAADRREFLTGVKNPLPEHEAKEAVKLARKRIYDAEHEGREIDEFDNFLIDLLKDWNDMRPKDSLGNMDGPGRIGWPDSVIPSLKSLRTNLDMRRSGLLNESTTLSRVDSELSIIKGHLRKLGETAKQETEKLEALEKEMTVFRECMNDRVAYYKRLQALSDMVEPFKEHIEDELDVAHLQEHLEKEREASAELKVHQERLRFLQHLSETATEEQSTCIICTDAVVNGVLTICGHQFCADCINEWFKQSKKCPLCKRMLTNSDLQQVTYRTQGMRAEEEHHDHGKPSASSSNGIASNHTASNLQIYSKIDASILSKIQSITLPVSHSTKIDTIARTLLYLRQTDPAAQSIIFSQFSDFLSTLSSALKKLSITHTSYANPSGVQNFRHDPSISVFLLDAKNDSSGINLVNATHVFLCEPFVNTAIELQGIARVHRIGQMRETTVWMVLVEGTVEEAVYRLSADRRVAHIARANLDQVEAENGHVLVVNGHAKPTNGVNGLAKREEALFEAANSLELEAAPVQSLLVNKAKGGGEIVETDDLWTCLFTKQERSRVDENADSRRVVERLLRADAAEGRIEEDHGTAGAAR